MAGVTSLFRALDGVFMRCKDGVNASLMEDSYDSL